jgi:hypothetical protein
MNRREFLKFLGAAATTAAVAPAALAEALDARGEGATGFQAVTGDSGFSGPGFTVLEPGMSIQEAISALPENGGTVYIQGGTYIVDEVIIIPDGVTLVAQGNLTISGCRISGEARKRGDAPIWMLMEEDDQIAIIGNRFDCEPGQSMSSWFYAPIGEELKRVKESVFQLLLRFKKLVV